MDRCWLDPDSERGRNPHVVIDPVYRGTTRDGDGGSSNVKNTAAKDYDAPEQLYCIFDSDAAASAILDPNKGSSCSAWRRSNLGQEF